MRFHHGRFAHWPRRRPRLRRQLFSWLALTIVITVLAVSAVFHIAQLGRSGYPLDTQRVETFVSERFAELWNEPSRRHTLAESLSRTLNATVRIDDTSGRELDRVGPRCERPSLSMAVERDGHELGRVALCLPRGPGRLIAIVAVATAGLVLWIAASVLAFRLTRPLSTLIAVTREIGAGNLKSRVRLRRAQRGELGMLADAINDMAERIERQINEQRELLAAVSHEVRSPLARLRVSTELLRENPREERALAAIEREVSEIDSLVGKLLASSRLDFGSLSRSPVNATELAVVALERHALPIERFEDTSDGAKIAVDPTLIARALDNLIDNAEQHGNGLTALRLRPARPGEHATPGRAVVYEVEDTGDGFDPAALRRVFEAFYRAPQSAADRASRASLGLGLSLVERIAQAHGGRAWAENKSSGGARVSFSAG